MSLWREATGRLQQCASARARSTHRLLSTLLSISCVASQHEIQCPRQRAELNIATMPVQVCAIASAITLTSLTYDASCQWLRHCLVQAKQGAYSYAMPFMRCRKDAHEMLSWLMQYIQWAGAEGHDVFFTDTEVKQLFKDHIDTMVNRRNTINNRLYKDDPTIFAWDLMNEPRCDCFPDFIPVPDSYVSCRPECAKKVQVSSFACGLLCALHPLGFLTCTADLSSTKKLHLSSFACMYVCFACESALHPVVHLACRASLLKVLLA